MPTRTFPTYSGPPPKAKADTEALRRHVPDDPIPLPSGSLACCACGVAVRTTEAVTATEMEGRTPGGQLIITTPVGFARCPSCCLIHERAREYVEAHPAFAARVGPEIAVERVEAVLCGLAIIGQDEPSDLGLLLPRLHPAAHGVRFSNPVTLVRDHCSPYPWAFVSMTQRADLRRAYADALKDRLSLGQPAVPIRCPTGGCVFCGVASVPRSAIEVNRRGGVEAVAAMVWREVNTTPKALGTNGPERVLAHACPDCARSIEDRGGIGWPARAQALVNYLNRTEPKKARRLRVEVESDYPPVLPAWRVTPKARPSVEPWQHLRRLIDRL